MVKYLASLISKTDYIKDNFQAKELFFETARKGHIYAQILVALNPEVDGYIKSYLNKVITQNERDGYAALGAAYSTMGNNVEALKYLNLSVDKGSVISATILSKNYICGTGVPKNIDHALKYRELAIRNGADESDLKEITKMLKNGCDRPYDVGKTKSFQYTAKNAVIDYYSRHRFDFGLIHDSLINYKFKN